MKRKKKKNENYEVTIMKVCESCGNIFTDSVKPNGKFIDSKVITCPKCLTQYVITFTFDGVTQ